MIDATISILEILIDLPDWIAIMGISLAITAATTFISTAIATASVVSAVVKTAIVVGASLLLRELQASEERDRSIPSFAQEAEKRTRNIKEPVGNRRIVYGKARVGGTIVFAENSGSDDKYLHMVIAHASHECQSIEKVFLDDTELSLNNSGFDTGSEFGNKVRVKKHLGKPDQTADADLKSETSKITDSHRFREVCYTYTRFEWDRETFGGLGIPTITVLLKGKNQIFDPRDDSVGYSTNPALCLRDYLTDKRLGLGASSDEIDDDSVINAANECDETVTNDDGSTENRYTMNGTINTGQDHRTVIEKMLTSMAGTMPYTSGRFHVKAGAFKNCGIELTEDDLASEIQVQSDLPSDQVANSVRGIYTSPDQNWEPTDFPAIEVADYINEDGEQKWMDLEFPFTTSSTEAQRLARIRLRKNRNPVTIEATFKMTAYETKVGDIIEITNDRFGWKKKTFEVLEWDFQSSEGGSNREAPPLSIRMKLRERPSTVYDNQQEVAQSTASSISVRDNTNVDAPTNFSVTDDPLVLEDGSLVPRFKLTWTKPDDIFVKSGGGIEIAFKRSSDSTYDSLKTVDGDTEKAFVQKDIEPGIDYDFRIRSINTDNNTSNWVTSTNNTASGNTSALSDVSNLSCKHIQEFAELTWDNVSDSDLSGYEIQVDKDSNFDEGTATKLADEHHSTRFLFPLSNIENFGDITFGVRAVDTSGNTSNNWTTCTLNVKNDLPVRTISSDTTLNDRDLLVKVDTSSNDVKVSLPAISGDEGEFRIKKVKSANTMLVSGQAGELIDGDDQKTIEDKDVSLTVQPDDTEYTIY